MGRDVPLMSEKKVLLACRLIKLLLRYSKRLFLGIYWKEMEGFYYPMHSKIVSSYEKNSL